MTPLEKLSQRVVTMSEKTRRNDDFRVTFYGLPDNLGDVLGRQVKSFTRPTFEVQVSTMRFRGNTYKDKENITMMPLSIAFHDDDAAVTSTILYMQLLRQMNKVPDRYGISDVGREYRFDIKLELFDANGEVTEGFMVRSAFIQSINHSDPDISAPANTEIVVMLEYDNLDLFFIDDYIRIK